MPDSFGSRVMKAWNAFRSRDQTSGNYAQYGGGYSRKPDRVRLSLGTERSTIASLYNRIAIDVAALAFQHVRVDQNGKYTETITDSLNDCLTLNPNLDQISRAFFQDAVLTLFDAGCIAIVPVLTSDDPDETGSYDIYQLRVGRIIEWYPKHVRLDVYNEEDGLHHEIVMAKDTVAIVENPLYIVMNEPNSTLRRLVRKMNLLDGVDEQTSSGKLDLLIQLPYITRSPAQMQRAEQRRKMIEEQLAGSKYGIAYIDGTERVTQLNRAVENNLLNQIEYLTKHLFNQLGVTEKIFSGEADEQESLNYHTHTIEPIASAIVDSMTRAFLTKTARTQGQRIMYFRDPFKLVPVSQVADIADKFTRNEVLSSNEVRAIVGYRPVDDARADELRNKNLNVSEDNPAGSGPLATDREGEEVDLNINFDDAQHSALEHHGVEGQKWGEQNGPPYPLKWDRSGMETIIKSLKKTDFKDFDVSKRPYYSKVEYNGDKPAGFVYVSTQKERGKRVAILDVAVDPAERGKGIAKRLSQAAIRDLNSDSQISKLYWGTTESNEGSLNLAKKLGFEYAYKTKDGYVVYEKPNK